LKCAKNIQQLLWPEVKSAEAVFCRRKKNRIGRPSAAAEYETTKGF
jgi:hypothetical protein